MDSISFESREKKSAAEETAYRRKTLLRIGTIASSTVLLLIIIIVVFSTMLVSNKSDQNIISNSTTSFDSLKVVCSGTLYPDSCYSSISSAGGENSSVLKPAEIFVLSVQVALGAVYNASAVSDEISDGGVDWEAKAALQDCKELFGSAAGHLNESLAILQAAANMDDIRALLSAAIADHSTCTEILQATPAALSMAPAMVNTTEYTSNTLAIATKYGNYIISTKFNPLAKPKPFFPSEKPPPLLNSAEGKMKANVTVAKDGTGDFESIKEAVEKVPENSLNMFVVYVKEGVYEEYVVVYEEYVVVLRSKWNVVMVGDGMNRTIVTGSRSRVGGITAYKSATFVVEGRRFTAMDMTFKNTAGPEKNQAAALLSKSDRSIFIRCSFHASHNTLYTHSLRQFYLNCEIIGSTDFIYGNAAVIFQNCSIRPALSISGQNNTISAQTRSDPNQNTGTVIRSSVISGLGDLSDATIYLGRPGGNYSRTVVMMTEMGEVVKPEGWMEMGPGTVPPDTIFFGEYRNSGNGSRLGGRVSWPGYRPKMSDEQAEDFSVESFIQGKSWIDG